jgi:hypothetical protein
VERLSQLCLRSCTSASPLQHPEPTCRHAPTRAAWALCRALQLLLLVATCGQQHQRHTISFLDAPCKLACQHRGLQGLQSIAVSARPLVLTVELPAIRLCQQLWQVPPLLRRHTTQISCCCCCCLWRPCCRQACRHRSTQQLGYCCPSYYLLRCCHLGCCLLHSCCQLGTAAAACKQHIPACGNEQATSQVTSKKHHTMRGVSMQLQRSAALAGQGHQAHADAGRSRTHPKQLAAAAAGPRGGCAGAREGQTGAPLRRAAPSARRGGQGQTRAAAPRQPAARRRLQAEDASSEQSFESAGTVCGLVSVSAIGLVSRPAAALMHAGGPAAHPSWSLVPALRARCRRHAAAGADVAAQPPRQRSQPAWQHLQASRYTARCKISASGELAALAGEAAAQMQAAAPHDAFKIRA